MTDTAAPLERSGRAVLALLAGYFVLHVVLRLLTPSSLELDEGEQLFFSQSLSLLYDSQPPFYNWLQYGAIHVFGVSVTALIVLKNLLLFLCYLLLWRTADLMLRDKGLAAIAALGLITINQVSFEAQRDLTHTVAALFSACLFLYAFILTLKAPSSWSYALTGLAAGIGMLSKYNFLLLPVGALIAILPSQDFRSRLFDWRILLTIIIGAVVVGPHGWQFIHHVDIATNRTIGKLVSTEENWAVQVAKGLGALALALVAFWVPPLLIFWLAFGRRLNAAFAASNPMSRLIGRMWIAIVVMLVLIVLFAGATDIRPRWLVPIFFPLPLWLCLKIEAAGPVADDALRRYRRIAGAIMAAILLILGLRAPVMGALGLYERPNVPYQPAISAVLASGPRPSLIVAADQQLAGNVRLSAADIPVADPRYPHLQPPYTASAAHPVLLIWRDKGEAVPDLPAELSGWLRTQPALDITKIVTQTIARPYYYSRSGDMYSFSYAWVYPVK